MATLDTKADSAIYNSPSLRACQALCLNCAGSGRSCRKCLRGEYSTSPPLLVPIGCNSAENNTSLNRKKNRFLVRAFRGVACGVSRGYRFRWFVLTESDEALKSGRVFSREFHRFVTWLRYYCPDFQYIGVRHRQGKASRITGQLRSNWHILSYGSDKLPLKQMREYWLSHYLSTITGMSEVSDIDKSIKYLAGYLGSGEKFVNHFQSQGWVFRGWVNFSRSYAKQYGLYPPQGLLATLALMSPVARSPELDWLRNTGNLSHEYYSKGVLK